MRSVCPECTVGLWPGSGDLLGAEVVHRAVRRGRGLVVALVPGLGLLHGHQPPAAHGQGDLPADQSEMSMRSHDQCQPITAHLALLLRCTELLLGILARLRREPAMPHLLPGLLDTSLKFILDAGPAAAAGSWEDVGRAPSVLCLRAPAAVVLGMPRMLMGLRYSWWLPDTVTVLLVPCWPSLLCAFGFLFMRPLNYKYWTKSHHYIINY